MQPLLTSDIHTLCMQIRLALTGKLGRLQAVCIRCCKVCAACSSGRRLVKGHPAHFLLSHAMFNCSFMHCRSCCLQANQNITSCCSTFHIKIACRTAGLPYVKATKTRMPVWTLTVWGCVHDYNDPLKAQTELAERPKSQIPLKQLSERH